MAKYSKKASAYIGRKMHAMKNENRPHKQKVAIAINKAKKRGFKIPKAKHK